MKILILGGTWFIGRQLTHVLREHHDVWHFNRGTVPMKDVNLIQGDRFKNETDKLKKFKCDIVIDLSCFNAEHFSNTYRYLRNNFNKYIFISTPSVKTDSLFGQDKLMAEKIIKRLPNYTIIRPAAVVGKYDYSNRFYFKNNKWRSSINHTQLAKNSYVTLEHLVDSIIKFIDENHSNKIYTINEQVGLVIDI